jgi:hypothetical protein
MTERGIRCSNNFFLFVTPSLYGYRKVYLPLLKSPLLGRISHPLVISGSIFFFQDRQVYE